LGGICLKVPLARPIFDDEMKAAAVDALQNEKFVLGESVFKFEEEFAKYCGTKFAVSTSSGTSALQLSLLALGVGLGDHVVTTPFSFIATSNATLHNSSLPVFADVEVKTYNIDPKIIEKKLSKKVRAVIPVHLFGFPADMNLILASCQGHTLSVVEDACQAHGAEYFGQKVGAIGDAGCFYFYSTKNMTVCGDGGMVVTNNEEVAKKVARLRDCGRVSHYEHDLIGYTARLNTVNAAIGRIQLRRLDEWNAKRREHAMLYDGLLSSLDDIILPPGENPNIKPVYHLYVIRTSFRKQLKDWLEKNSIQCGIHYPIPIHLQPIYRKLFDYDIGDFPNSELLSETVLSLPMFPDLKREEVKFICEKIGEFFNHKNVG